MIFNITLENYWLTRASVSSTGPTVISSQPLCHRPCLVLTGQLTGEAASQSGAESALGSNAPGLKAQLHLLLTSGVSRGVSQSV